MISENIKKIQFDIEEACEKIGKKASDIEIIGVTKTVGVERINEAIHSGITHVGENRVQEYLEKYDFFKENHLKTSIIGHLQTNKVKYIIDKVDMIQSVDSIKLCEEISKRASAIGRTMDVLLEINVAGEESKFGVSTDEIIEFVHNASELSNIRVRGIMSIPPVFENEIKTREYFSKLYKIYIDIKAKKLDNVYMDTLSMGMSKDYYYAILEGANMVRIGTGIFGRR